MYNRRILVCFSKYIHTAIVFLVIMFYILLGGGTNKHKDHFYDNTEKR